MSLFIDKKFVSIVGMKLDRFKQKSDYLWNCRCPICKDSKKNKLKARGYFYRKKANIHYACHNCHRGMPLWAFLKAMDPSLYQQYQLEVFTERPSERKSEPSMKEFLVMAPRKPIKLPSIDSLDPNHEARKYISSRQIPVVCWKDLYWAEDFLKFCEDTFDKERFEGKSLRAGEARVIIPFLDEEGKLLGVQGRSLSNSGIRYITIKAHEEARKVFGLNTVNFDKPIYVVEGPIDSLFLSNSLASMDSALYRIEDIVGKRDYIFVYDNQPRNPQVVKTIKKTIDKGYKVCVWPPGFEGKDLNEMILDGMGKAELKEFIDKHVFEGLRAQLELEMWRKV